MATVAIPSSVTSIGDSAFYYCTSLTNITIPSSVTDIGHSAFWFCSSLTSITIPRSVTNFRDYALFGCTGLTSVYSRGNAPSGNTTVFGGDNNVTAYYLPGTTGWTGFAISSDTSAVVLLRAAKPPRSITLAGQPVENFTYSPADGLVWIRFANEARPRDLTVQF